MNIATIFSFAANEEQDAIGDIPDESFEVSALNSSAKEFLNAAIADYNACFQTNFSVDSKGFQNYYRDLAKRVKSKEVDLLIVVGMASATRQALNSMIVSHKPEHGSDGALHEDTAYGFVVDEAEAREIGNLVRRKGIDALMTS